MAIKSWRSMFCRMNTMDKRYSVLGNHCANDIHDYDLIIIVIIIFIIIIIFMMCRFNEYAGFTWSSCHAGVVRFFFGQLPRALICLRQTAHSVMLTTACRRHVHSANEFRWHEYRSALSVDQSD